MARKPSEKRQRSSTPKSATSSHKAESDSCVAGEDPLPMRDRKPTSKRPNAAESFWNSHQAEHEARAQPPSRCQYVDSHNDACPKLKDELDRRRDTSKPIACQTMQELCQVTNSRRCGTQTRTNPHCILRNDRRRYAAHLSSRTRRERDRRPRRSRVSKSKRRPPPRRPINTNKAATESDNVERPTADPHVTKSDVGSSKYHNISPKPSVSSYNSFLSMSHEPMDSK